MKETFFDDFWKHLFFSLTYELFCWINYINLASTVQQMVLVYGFNQTMYTTNYMNITLWDDFPFWLNYVLLVTFHVHFQQKSTIHWNTEPCDWHAICSIYLLLRRFSIMCCTEIFSWPPFVRLLRDDVGETSSGGDHIQSPGLPGCCACYWKLCDISPILFWKSHLEKQKRLTHIKNLEWPWCVASG